MSAGVNAAETVEEVYQRSSPRNVLPVSLVESANRRLDIGGTDHLFPA
jgi:hypothetical protein